MVSTAVDLPVLNLLVCPICRRAFPNRGRPVACLGSTHEPHPDTDTLPYRAWPHPPKESS